MDVKVVFAGHVDHGKSTLIGRLLYDSGSVKEGQVAAIQRLAEELKSRFEFAHFLDAFDDELREERTIDTTNVMFQGKNLYTVIDVPGHKEFIKQMLTGASQADVAVLVVATDEGIQEQTGRHTFLVKMLGIRRVFVLINKMDLAAYKQTAYQRTANEMSRLLDSLGYEAEAFIPGSAMAGDNICRQSSRMPWYDGPTLIEALDRVELSHHEKPLRFTVQAVYNVNSVRIVTGRVESGRLRKGDTVVFYPSAVSGQIESIRTFGSEPDYAETGDSVGVVTGCEPRRGDVCGLLEDPPKLVDEFLGEITLLDDSLSRGDTLELRCATQTVRCQVKHIEKKIDPVTGQVTEEHAERMGQHEVATVLFATEPLVVEDFSDIPELGRFVLVREKNIGAGIVLQPVNVLNPQPASTAHPG